MLSKRSLISLKGHEDDTLCKLINIYAENSTTCMRFRERMPIYSVGKLKKIASIKKSNKPNRNQTKQRCKKNHVYAIAESSTVMQNRPPSLP